MNVTEAIRARRSVRRYREGAQIPEEDLRTILEAAMMAPSACNTRPWEFVVVRTPEVKDALVRIHPFCKQLREASLGIVVCALPEQQSGIAKDFFPQDCGAAIENILLQALELGYGTCWCGLYPKMTRVEAVQKLLDVHSTPVAIVTLGIAAEEPPARGHYEEEKVLYR